MFMNNIYQLYMYKKDLALIIIQWLINYKTRPKRIKMFNLKVPKLSNNNS